MDLSVSELVSLWLAGESPEKSDVVGCLRVVWWVRGASVAQLLAGTVVLLDVVGEKRLRAWGKSIYGLVKPSRLARNRERWRLRLEAQRLIDERATLREEPPNLPNLPDPATGMTFGPHEHPNPNYSPEKNAEIREKRAELDVKIREIETVVGTLPERNARGIVAVLVVVLLLNISYIASLESQTLTGASCAIVALSPIIWYFAPNLVLWFGSVAGTHVPPMIDKYFLKNAGRILKHPAFRPSMTLLSYFTVVGASLIIFMLT